MTGRRVLLAWELGGNLGHLSRLLAFARMVQQSGATPILALPAHAMASPWLASRADPRVQVPAPVVIPHKVDVLSYASILLNVGFSNPAGIARAVGAWRTLVESIRPDLVVLDTAPMAQLASCLFRWPALQISNGFDSPPAACPSLDVGWRGPYVERLNALHVAKVELALQRTAQLLRAGAGPSLAAYLRYPRRYFDCIATTDPYGARDDVHYVGPLLGLQGLHPPTWPDDSTAGGLRVFAYLRGSPLLRPVLHALCRENANVLCVADRATASDHSASSRGARVTSSPVQLDLAVRLADLVVSYGAVGVVTLARMAGRPQLLAPNDVEKLTVARQLARAGAAAIVRRADDVTESIELAARIKLDPIAADASSMSRLQAELAGGPASC